MRRLIAFAVSLLSLSAGAAQNLETPAFRLTIDDGWKITTSPEPEQRLLYSSSQDVAVTTSYLLYNATPSDTERLARKLKEFRLEGEQAAATYYGVQMTIAEPIVVPVKSGHQVAYFGHDNTGREFRYLGLVYPNKSINVYAESDSRSQAELEAIFGQLLEGLAP